MWISREEYERLRTRVKDAEERLSHSEYRERHLNDLIWDMRANKDNEENSVEEEEMTYKWAIFYKDGSVRFIYACDYIWDNSDETLSFTNEDENAIACFRLGAIDGVAMVCDYTPVGIEEPMIQLPAPVVNEPKIHDDGLTSPWVLSHPWQQTPVTWNNTDNIKPLAERGTE